MYSDRSDGNRLNFSMLTHMLRHILRALGKEFSKDTAQMDALEIFNKFHIDPATGAIEEVS